MITIITSLVLLICLIICIILSIRVWLKKKEYTRQKFAFYSTTIIFAFLGTTVASVFNGEAPWQSAIYVVYRILGINYVPHITGPIEYLFIFGLFYLAINTIKQFYNNWDGQISVESMNLIRRNVPIGLRIESMMEFKRIINRLPVPEIYSPTDTSKLINTLQSPKDTLSWHFQARELIMLKSNSYHFDLNNWHDQKFCWVGENKKTKDIVFLMCVSKSPTLTEFQNYTEYVQTYLIKNDKLDQNVILLCAIKEDYPNENIELNGFTIDIHCEKTLLDDLIDFTEYIDDVKYRVEKEKLPDSSFCLADIYTISNFTTEDSSIVQNDIEAYLKCWLDDSRQRQLALLGEYGQGKSTCSLLFTYHLMFNSTYNKKRFPIILELRGKSPRDMSTIDLIATWAARYNINPNALMKLLIAGRLLLILEGFDEMALIGNMEMRLNHFRTLWQFCFPNSKILITGRPNFFLDDMEMKAALGIKKSSTGHPFCQALLLAPFNIPQIEYSLRYLSDKVRKEIISLAKRDIKFFEIVSRPSLLFIVGLLWEKENLSKYKDNINSAFVISLFIKNSYRRQGVKISDGIDFMALNTSEREYFMSGIATYIAVNSLPNQISKEQLYDVIERLFKNIPESVSEMDAISGEVTRPLKSRMSGDENAIEHINTDVRACGLLISDPTKSGSFRFAHKSFMEYLFAEVVAIHMTKDFHTEKIIELNCAIIKSTDTIINKFFENTEFHPIFSELLSSFLTKDKLLSELELCRNLFNFFVMNNPKSIVMKLIKKYEIIVLKYHLIIETYSNNFWMRQSLGFIPIIIFSFIYYSMGNYIIDNFIKEGYAKRLFMVLFNLFFVFLPLSTSLTTTKRLKIKSWYHCCKDIGIDDEIIRNVIGLKPTQYLKTKNEYYQ